MAREDSLKECLHTAWQRGLKDKKSRVVFEDFRTFACKDKTLPYEIRYLPSLEKKASAMSSRNASRDASDAESGDENDKSSKKTRHVVTKNGLLSTLDASEELSVANKHVVQQPKDDPFAPPRDNVVKEYDNYTLVLNMYPLETHHFLCVTNDFVPQKGRLRPEDLLQMRQVLCELGVDVRPYGFFNGGEIAGASQHHRHMQFMRMTELEAASKGEEVWPETIVRLKQPVDAAHPDVWVHPDLEAAHFLTLVPEKPTAASLAAAFNSLYALAQATNTETAADETLPYNFLMTHDFMLLFPRRKDEYQGCGVGGTCLVGCLCAESMSDVDILRKAGLNEILKTVGVSH